MYFTRFVCATVLAMLWTSSIVSKLHAAAIAGSGRGFQQLGTGFDPVSSQFKQTCVEGTRQQSGGAKSEISSSYAEDLENLEKIANTSGSGSFDVGIVGGGVSVSYFARVLKTKRRESLILNYQSLQAPWSFQKDIQLDDNGQRLLSMGSDFAREQCGSEFITQINGMFRLLLSISFDFASEDSYEYYRKKTTAKALFGAVKKSKTTIKELKEYKNSLLVRIDGIQEGGYPERLNTILKKAPACRADEVETCLDVLDEAIRYATDTLYPGGLQQQMNQGIRLYPGSAGGPAVASYLTASYASTGIEALVDSSNRYLAERQYAKNAVDEISRQIRTIKSLEQRARSQKALLAGPLDGQLAQLLLDVSYNQVLLEDAYQQCSGQDTFLVCESVYNQTRRELRPMNETILDKAQPAPALPEALKCGLARLKAREKQFITERQYEVYETINYAPEYSEARNPDADIIGWGECSNLVSQL